MMDKTSAPAIVVFGEYWVVGTVPTQGYRILDVLNNPESDYLDIHDAEVFRKAERETRLASLPQAVVPKDQLSLLIITTSEHEAPTRRSYSRVTLGTGQAFLISNGYTVQGDLHLKNGADQCRITFGRNLNDFFPITNAVVSRGNSKPQQAAVVIVNKSTVSLFSMGEETPTAGRQSQDKRSIAQPPNDGDVESFVIGGIDALVEDLRQCLDGSRSTK